MTNSNPLHYWRCVECLTPFAAALETPQTRNIKQTPAGTRCECGNAATFEYMGKVTGAYWNRVETAEICECNEICAHARGPSCSCECNGANHGRGMMLAETVTESGTVRTARATAAALNHAGFYRAVMTAFETRTAFGRYADFVDSYHSHDYIERGRVPAAASYALYHLVKLRREFVEARTPKKRSELWARICKLAETEPQTQTA